MNSLKRTQQGFTLIEVMVVVVIIGILFAMVVPNVIGNDDKARVAAAKVAIKSVSTALDLYKLDNHSYPTTDEGFEVLVKPEKGRPFLNSLPKDPWGNPLEYISPGATLPYEIYSLGADGQEGGEDYAADISNEDI